MVFDPNPHLFRMLIIRCGELLKPGEMNITTLYNEMVARLGVLPQGMTTVKSDYDPFIQFLRLTVIRAGEKIREARGLPKEEDLDKLYNETINELGMIPIVIEGTSGPTESQIVLPSEGANKLPAPHEMTTPGGKFLIPRRFCPGCKKESVVLAPLCLSCKDAEGGKYKSIWKCTTPNCLFQERSEKAFVSWLDELGIDWKSGTKESMGIMTMTEKGLVESKTKTVTGRGVNTVTKEN